MGPVHPDAPGPSPRHETTNARPGSSAPEIRTRSPRPAPVLRAVPDAGPHHHGRAGAGGRWVVRSGEAVKAGFASSFRFAGRTPRDRFWRLFGVPFAVACVGYVYALILFLPKSVPSLGFDNWTFSFGVQAEFDSVDVASQFLQALKPTGLVVLFLICSLISIPAMVQRVRDGGNNVALIPILLLLGPVLVFLGNFLMLKLLVAEHPGLSLLIGTPIQWFGLLIAIGGPVILFLWLLHPSYPGTSTNGPNPNEVPQ